MIYSMTGFAEATSTSDLGTLSVELRSLNHRYCEINVRMPEDLRFAEAILRERVSKAIGRGKVDATVRFKPDQRASGRLAFNADLANELAAMARHASTIFPDARQASVAEWLAWPGMVEAAPPDLSPLSNVLAETVDAALERLLAHRAREGERLQSLVESRLDDVTSLSNELRASLPEIREQQANRLRQRVSDLSEVAMEPGRLEQEVVVILQRLDVDEELDRLDAHVAEARHSLNSNKPVGRRLDFLMQEFNREANTLGSKAASETMTRTAVDLKVVIEQMREQIQNIE